MIRGLERLVCGGEYPADELRLGDLLGEESEIIKAYPELADTKVVFDRKGMVGGGYDPESGNITLRTYAAERQPDGKDVSLAVKYVGLLAFEKFEINLCLRQFSAPTFQ